MKLKTTVQYYLSGQWKGMLIFWGAFALVLTMGLIFSSGFFMNGLEIPPMVYLFVAGLNSFKGEYQFAMANGVSRRTNFAGCLLSAVPISIFMSLVSTVSMIPLSLAFNFEPLFRGMYVTQFSKSFADMLSGERIGYLAQYFVWAFMLFVLVFMIGYFLSLLYFRMNRILKILVSVGVPLLVIFGSNIIALASYQAGWGQTFWADLDQKLGLTTLLAKPEVGIFLVLVIALLVIGLSYLLIRRAPVKE